MEPGREEELFVRFRSTGDAGALAEVYDRIAPELLLLAMHVARDPAEAEDMVQACFLVAIEKADAFDASRRLRPWLVGILTNEARMARRRASRGPDVTRLRRSLPDPPIVEAELGEFTRAVDECIARLPEAYQSVLVLRLKHGLAPAEIAHALRRPPGTVRTQLVRGLELLQRALPAGFALGAAALLTPTRGLAAVKAAILAKAASTTVPAVLGATLAMKKMVLAVTAVVVLGALAIFEPWQARGRTETDERRDTGGTAPSMLGGSASPPSPGVEGSRRPMEAAARQGMGALRVHVRWHDGSPASAVGVSLTPQLADGLLQQRSSRTADDGNVLSEGLPPARWQVALDRCEARAESVIEAGHESSVELTVPRGVDVAGSVLEANGRGVANACLWLSERTAFDRGREAARTDAAGRFSLRSVEPGRALCAFAKGWRPPEMQVVAGKPGETTEMVFVISQRGPSIRGRVLDDLGRPLPGAKVRLGSAFYDKTSVHSEGSTGPVPQVPPILLETDAAGEFAAYGPRSPFGEVIWVRAPGFAPFSSGYAFASPGEERFVEIRLARGASLAGRVVDESGAPVAGAVIEVRPCSRDRGPDEPDWAQHAAVTGRDGSYQMTGLRPGPLRARAWRGTDAARVDLMAGDGQELQWQAKLRAPLTIEGVVVDSAGVPLANCSVWAASNGGHPFAQTLTAPTSGTGAFVVRGCEAATFWLKVECADRRALAFLPSVAAGSRDLRLTVPVEKIPSAYLTGAVAVDAGRARRSVSVSVKPVDGHGGTDAVFDPETRRFRAGPMAAGDHVVVVSVDGAWAKVAGPYAVAAGETLDCGVIELHEPGSIRARLMAEEPLEGPIWGIVMPAQGPSWLAIVFKDGAGVSKPLEPGRYWLSLQGTGVTLAGSSVEVRSAQESQVALRVPRGVTRRFRLLHPPIDEATLVETWRHRGGEVLCKRSYQYSGSPPWEVSHRLAPGDYELEMVSHAGHRGKATFRVADLSASDEAIEIELR